MTDEEEVYVLSGEEFSESLVLLELRQPKTLQEQTKQYTELKNSFLALLKAYEDMRKKLVDARAEISNLKKRKNKSDSIASPMQKSASSICSSDSLELAKVLMLYNERVVDILNQVEKNTPLTVAPPVEVNGNQDASIQTRLSMVEAETQYDQVPSFMDEMIQTGESLIQPSSETPQIVESVVSQPSSRQSSSVVASSTSAVDPNISVTSSFVITDDSDDDGATQENSNKVDTIRPAVPATSMRIIDSQLGRLLVDNSRVNPNSGAEFNYRCPVCGQEFENNALEAQAVAHLMQCTAPTKDGLRRDCPICGNAFEITTDSNQTDFEVHVQTCCEAGDLGAVVL